VLAVAAEVALDESDAARRRVGLAATEISAQLAELGKLIGSADAATGHRWREVRDTPTNYGSWWTA
jgi:hypothetical protein